MRTIIGLMGALAALFPKEMLEVFEAAAVANSEKCSTRSWITTGIRAEGVVVTVVSLVGGRAYAWLVSLTGVFGALLLVVPDAYRTIATTLLYERPEDVEWNERATISARAIGALYLIIALLSLVRRGSED